MEIFNRKVIKLHRDRAATKALQHDFIIKKISQMTCERLSGDFSLVLNLGAHTGQLLNFFSRCKKIISSDLSENMLKKINGSKVVLDEEFIPFTSNSFDAVISIATLHRVNDLPGSMVQIHNILKSNGIFIGTLFGPNTLRELKASIIQVGKGVSPMVFPFVDIKDAGMLMRRAGFHMAVADTDSFTVNYSSVDQLFTDLRYIGETNALIQMRKNFVTKTELATIRDKYEKSFSDEKGRISATFEIVTMTGIKNVDMQKN